MIDMLKTVIEKVDNMPDQLEKFQQIDGDHRSQMRGL